MSNTTKFSISSLIVVITISIISARCGCDLWITVVLGSFILSLLISVISGVEEDYGERVVPVFICGEQKEGLEPFRDKEQAFDIAKAKKVNLGLLNDVSSVEEYNNIIPVERALSEEEFLFLKEMLL